MANEDVHGLYEAAAAMKGVFSQQSEDENRAVAATLLKQLLAEKLISLCIERGFPTGRKDTGGRRIFRVETTPIPTREIEKILSSNKSWEPYRPDDEGIGFYATTKGGEGLAAPESKLAMSVLYSKR